MANRRRNLTEHLHGRRRTNTSPHRNPQRHAGNGATSWGQRVNTTGLKRRDVHEMSLNVAKGYIVDDVRDARSDGTAGVLVCHGFNHGTMIRDWVRNGPLAQSLASHGIEAIIAAVDEGNTAVRLR